MKKDKMFEAPEEFFWMRVRVARAGYERPPLLDAVRTNTIGATQAQTQRDEVLGGSSGRPNQIFQLAFTPVLNGTLQLEVDEGQEFQPWTQVADFFASTDEDSHFALNRTTGEVRFGDGKHGRIPVGNVDNPDGNIVARVYRYGGGKKGNAAAGTLTNLLGGTPGVDANKITNLRPATGGRDEETLDEAKLRAPQALKNKCRAVTAEDFEALAMQAPGVKRAKALPLAHPGFPGRASAGGGYGDHRSRQRRSQPDSERRNDPHCLRLSRPAPPAHDRALRRRRRLITSSGCGRVSSLSATRTSPR